MNKDDPIVIERTANGYIIRPLGGQNCMFSPQDFLVFQDIGYVSAQRDNQPTEKTLLGFVAEHFTDENSPRKD